jgi:uncharacterized protein YozE (UPF0346 family)
MKIPFVLPDHIKTGIRTRTDIGISNYFKFENGHIQLGINPSESATLYSPGKSYPCLYSKDFLGEDLGIIIFSKKSLFLIELFREYLHLFNEGKTTIFAFHSALVRRYQDGNCPRAPSISLFTAAWNYFVQNLDIDYSLGFCCPLCQDSPSVVLGDGTAIGFQKKHLPELKSTTETETPFAGSVHRDRIFIIQTQLRKKLLKFIESDVTTKINLSEFDNLINELTKNLKELVNLIKFVKKDEDGEVYCDCDPRIKDFLMAVSSTSPVSSTVPLESVVMIENVINGLEIRSNVNYWNSFLNMCPIIAGLVLSFNTLTIPELFHGVLLKMVEISKKMLNYVETPDYLPSTISMGVFPSLPLLRGRGYYVADQNTAADPCRDDFDCKKLKKSMKSLTPGVFTLFCQHGVCYGFEIMVDSESPNTPFTILRTRFRSAPKTVVYDNACHLMAYSLNRDPARFRDTTFLVDRFHWGNHTSCSPSFSLNKYNGLKFLNSQITEQTNSSLSKLRTQLSYMTLDNFKLHAQLYLFLRNSSKIARLKETDIGIL